MAPRYKPSASSNDPRITSAFQEVYSKEPANVKATGKTGAARNKMMQAIALSKARQAGAKVPEKG